MTEQSARTQGLRFTGTYERSYDHLKVKHEAARIRKLGFRAVVCRVPDDKLSRGPRGVGHSVYAEQAYFDRREYDLLVQQTDLTQFTARVKALQDKQDQEMQQLWDKQTQLVSRRAVLELLLTNRKSD